MKLMCRTGTRPLRFKRDKTHMCINTTFELLGNIAIPNKHLKQNTYCVKLRLKHTKEVSRYLATLSRRLAA